MIQTLTGKKTGPHRTFAIAVFFWSAAARRRFASCGLRRRLCVPSEVEGHLAGDFDVGFVFMFCSGRLAFQSGSLCFCLCHCRFFGPRRALCVPSEVEGHPGGVFLLPSLGSQGLYLQTLK
jgi:hypothetical protein